MPIRPSHCIAMILALLTGCLLSTDSVIAANAPTTVSQIALYQGADREKILIEGAKKEAAFTLYGSHTWYRTMAKEFEKKYPLIKVTEYRTDGRTLIKRALESRKEIRRMGWPHAAAVHQKKVTLRLSDVVKLLNIAGNRRAKSDQRY